MAVALMVTACGFCTATPLYALEIDSDTQRIDLATTVEVLEDPQGTLSRQDVERPELARQFRHWPVTEGSVNFGFTRSAYWLRIPLQRTATAPALWLLELRSSLLEQIDFYAPNTSAVHTGSNLPADSRPYFHRFFVLPVALTTEPQYVYLRVASSYALTVPLTLWQPRAFEADTEQTNFIQAIYYGGVIALLLYNLLIFSSLRDQRFLLYALFAFFFGLGICAGNGYGRLFLWPQSHAFDQIAQSLFLSLGAAFGVCFTTSFLKTRSHDRLIHRLLHFFNFPFIAIALYFLGGLWWPLPREWGFQALMLAALPAGTLFIVAAGRRLRDNHSGVRYFFLAWGTLWLGAALATLRAFGWIPTTPVTSYILQIASAIEMLLLSFALADQMREERLAREEAQSSALASQRKLVASLKASEDLLEGVVQERTAQLVLALHQEKVLLDQYVRFGELISHDFRNTLGIVDSHLSLLRKESDKGIADVAHHIPIIAGASQRLATMFETWLRNDGIRQSLQRADRKQLVLPTWLKEFLSHHSHLSKGRQVTLSPATSSATICADEPLLALALSNLIENACKYSAPEHPLAIEIRQKSGATGIAVTDWGIGISPQHHTEIFNKYFRVAPEGTVRGLGLGLSLVQDVAHLHGGHVELESALGQGSTFCLWLSTEENSSNDSQR